MRDKLQQAFERGFFKAATDNGVPQLQAAILTKQAAEAVGATQPMTPNIPKAPTPSIGKQIGNYYNNQANRLTNASGFGLNALRNWDAGKTMSNAVSRVKSNVNDAMPGLQAYQAAATQGIKDMGQGLDYLATNSIPNVMETLNTQGPKAIDELVSKYGPDIVNTMADSSEALKNLDNSAGGVGGALHNYLNDGTMIAHTPDEVGTYQPNTNNFFNKLQDYFEKGEGTNTVRRVEDAIRQRYRGLATKPVLLPND